MRIAILGLSITSSWGNGHATLWRGLIRALTAAGHPPEWIVYDGEGHGWRTLEHQFDFYHRVEHFLAEQLKPAPPVRAATQ